MGSLEFRLLPPTGLHLIIRENAFIMELYTNSPNIFSSKSIAEGPEYIEKLFELLIGGPNRPIFEYISIIEKLSQKVNVKKRILLLFYKAYFLQKAMAAESSDSEKVSLGKRALASYEVFLREKSATPEIRYYAQWQMGLLQESLDYPWPQVQYTLLKARPLNTTRAEAHTKLVRHYLRESNWPLAYLFNSFSTEQFYNHYPSGSWGIDLSCYNWRILDKQWAICAALDKQEELKIVKKDLTDYFQAHKRELPANELDYIAQKLNPWIRETGLHPIQ